jgi:integrase
LIAAVDVSALPFGYTDRAIFLAAAMTGMRQGELLALRWRDVDWKAKRIRVRRNYTRGHWSTPKSRSGERSVPLSSKVEAELRAHLRRSPFSGEDDLVFANPLSGEVLPHGPLVRRFKKALKVAGVREIRFHDLRHTFGTRIAAAGVPMRVLQEWMGHRDYRTTLIYADYEQGDDESGMVDDAFS